jgi:hypothetical protein
MVPSCRAVSDRSRWRSLRGFALSASTVVSCGFDSSGVASGPNASGVVDTDSTTSTGSTTADAGSLDSSAGSASTMATSSPSTTDGDDTTTASPTTTTGSAETTSTDADATSTSPVSDSVGEEGGSSSESTTGEGPSAHYDDCSFETERADCGPSPAECQAYETDQPGDGHVCHLPCELGECPPPPDGDAVPDCYEGTYCVLDCGGGLTCPASMICDFSFSFDQWRCVWP